jgi:hypothetical protein
LIFFAIRFMVRHEARWPAAGSQDARGDPADVS